MKYTGRAQVHPRSPTSFGVCDRCGFLYNLQSLKFQFDYRGMQLQSTGFKVCRTCYDTPNPQRRPLILPPDPVPLRNPRVQDYGPSRNNFITTQGSVNITTQADNPLVTQETLDVDDMS